MSEEAGVRNHSNSLSRPGRNLKYCFFKAGDGIAEYSTSSQCGMGTPRLPCHPVQQIIRVLKPGGVAILSDYKHTAEYAGQLSQAGLMVERRWGNPLYKFPPLRIVIARKTQLSLR